LVNSTNKTGLINALKTNPNNQSYLNLVAYLEFRLSTILAQLMLANGIEEIAKLQGRGQEVSDFLADLRRKPIEKQYTGSFN